MAPVQPLIVLLKTEVDEPSQVMLMTVEEHLGMQLLEVTVFPPQDRVCLRENPAEATEPRMRDRILVAYQNRQIQPFPQVTTSIPFVGGGRVVFVA